MSHTAPASLDPAFLAQLLGSFPLPRSVGEMRALLDNFAAMLNAGPPTVGALHEKVTIREVEGRGPLFVQERSLLVLDADGVESGEPGRESLGGRPSAGRGHAGHSPGGVDTPAFASRSLIDERVWMIQT